MALFSKVKICNMALSKLGARNKIEDIEQATAEAEACNMWYDLALETTLEAFDWSFAKKRAVLATSPFDPPEGVWAFRYTWPVDCVAPRTLEHPQYNMGNNYSYSNAYLYLEEPDSVPFTVELGDTETKTILCNLEDAVLVYTSRVENPVVYTVSFVDALTFALASNMALQLTGKTTLAEKHMMYFERSIKKASAREANQGVKPPERDAAYIRGRY